MAIILGGNELYAAQRILNRVYGICMHILCLCIQRYVGEPCARYTDTDTDAKAHTHRF